MPDPYGRDAPSPIGKPTRSGVELVPPPGNPPEYPWYLKPIPVNTRDIEAELRAYTDALDPQLARWLYSTWNAEVDAIKDQELRNAIRDGQLSREWIAQWQADYAALINERFAPAWEAAMRAGAAAGLAGLGFDLDLQAMAVREWLAYRTGELITNLPAAQQQAVRNLIRYFMTRPEGVPGPAALGRYLRPVIGLTVRQERAVRAYRARLLADGMPLSRVEHLVENYASRLRRLRGLTIARTELSMAFNYGHYYGMQQANAAGLFPGRLVKVWKTARDERVCPTCGALENRVVGLDETYPVVGSTQYVPPGHVRCRCTVGYRALVAEDFPYPTVADWRAGLRAE